jgi:hypothetical protein
MKMTYADFTNTTFLVQFCIGDQKHEATIRPIVDDEWVTINDGDNYYDVNLWLDDNVGTNNEGQVRFGVYHVKPDPDNSTDGMWITDHKMVCSSDCAGASIEVIC